MTTQPLFLHYAPDNASLVVRLALEETGIRYQTVLVDRGRSAQRDPEYLRLNPNGLIPVLETPKGAIFETAAILLWIVDGTDGLGPAPTATTRGDFLKWLFFLSNTLHPALRMLFYSEKYIGDDARALDLLVAKTQENVLNHLNTLEAAWHEIDAHLALRLYIGPMIRWLQLYPAARDKNWLDLRKVPTLFEAMKRLEQRPSVLRAATLEGLGANPFSAPRLPEPPEGSAT